VKIYIYTLSDPTTNEVRYCGKTKDMSIRYKSHLKTSPKYKNRKRNWVKSLKNKGIKPVMEVIDIVDVENWNFWEKYWISQLKSWGFNLVNGNNGGGFDVTGFKHTEESKNKITNAQKGRKLSEEWKRNISIGRSGITFSENHIKNLSKSHKGKKANNNKIIYQIDMKNGEILNKFESIKNALKYLNVDLKNSNISKVCKNKLKSVFGYYWCYEDDYDKYSFLKYKRKNQKTIIQYDKNGKMINKFESISEASNFTGIKRDYISHVVNDNIVSAGNFIWLFDGDENKLQNKINRCKKDYIILQIKDNQIINTYNSIKEAFDKTNIKHIGSVINGNRKIAGGFDWKKQLNQ